jgi:hypothetical protein
VRQLGLDEIWGDLLEGYGHLGSLSEETKSDLYLRLREHTDTITEDLVTADGCLRNLQNTLASVLNSTLGQ